jgi:hypothetical protein
VLIKVELPQIGRETIPVLGVGLPCEVAALAVDFTGGIE